MLRRKMWRDIRFNKTQFITIFLMVLLGVLAYSGIRSYMDGMAQSADKFYSECNMQDLDAVSAGAVGVSFTNEDVENIKKIEHVNDAESKIQAMGTIKDYDNKSVQLNFISSNNISKLYVVDGEQFDSSKSGIWLDEYYANKNNWKVGDTLKISYDEYTLEEKIVALVNVPDHVYDVKDESAIFPTHVDYGFAYLSINEYPREYIKKTLYNQIGNMAEANIGDELNLDDYLPYNYIMVDVDSEDNKSYVKKQIDETIADSVAVLDIKDEASYMSYQGEIEEGETYVSVFSGLFIIIAILSVVTTMTRVVEKQRIQIGTLKALGFKKSKISMHYVGYGFWISLVAAVIGIYAGVAFIGNLFIYAEMTYYQVPNAKAVIASSSYLVAAITVLIISLVTYLTCRKVLKEPPADTLKAKVTKVKESSLNITTKGIFKKMKFASKWNLRDIMRNKARSIMGIVGISACCMLIVCAMGMMDSINNFLDIQFEKIDKFKYQLTLSSDVSDSTIDDLQQKYGYSSSETLTIEIKNGENMESNSAFINDSDGLVKILNHDWKEENLPDDGVVITEKLADTLGVSIGDTIEWHIYGDSNYYKTKVSALNRNPQTQSVQMSRKYYDSLGINEYKPDVLYTNDDLSNVESIDGVEVIQDKSALKNGMSSMLSTMKSIIALIIVIAAALGVVIIYNLGVLSFTEKQYQFATLKVLGFKDKQIKKIFVKQNNWLTYIAIVIGLPLGYAITEVIFRMAIADNYDFEAYIKPISYVYGLIGTLVVSVVVSKFLSKKINKIDMVSSLKGNE